MKKMIILFALLSGLSFGQEQIELSLGVEVAPERIEFQGLEFWPQVVATNIATEWRTVDEVVTNLYLGVKPDEVVTNTVQQQFEVVTVATNEAHWTAAFTYDVAAGTSIVQGGAVAGQWPRSTKLKRTLNLAALDLQSAIGTNLYVLVQSASEAFGPLKVQGPLKDALLPEAAELLQGGSGF